MKNIRNIIVIVILFMFISLGNLYNYDITLFSKQLIWYVIGFILVLISTKLKYKNSIRIVYFLYIILNILLLYLLLFGDIINGSKAWLNIFGISIQPSEFMKIVLIILLSYISTSNNKYLLKCFIITLIPSILTFLEPDTGNVIFYIVIYLSIISGKHFKYFVCLCLPLVGILILIYFYNIDILVSIFGSSIFYRLDRLINLNESYQLNMALIGISNSKLFGITNILDVPEVTTDFMFTLNIMNYGLIGLIIYLVLNMLFNIYLIRMMDKSIGVTKKVIKVFLIMKLFQEGIHIGMNVGLLPITGITLPFISYGGSSLLSYFIILIYILDNYKDSSLDMGMVFDKEG